MQPDKPLAILTSSEVDEAIASHALRKLGIDPDAVAPRFTAAYRIIDGRIIASVYFDDVSPRPKDPA